MGKYFFLTLFICGLFFHIESAAQICKISGTNDTIEVFGANYNNGTIEIILSNDSKFGANVSIAVEVKYVNGKTTEVRSFQKKALAKPMQSTVVTMNVPTSVSALNNVLQYDSFTVKSISGNKCDN